MKIRLAIALLVLSFTPVVAEPDLNGHWCLYGESWTDGTTEQWPYKPTQHLRVELPNRTVTLREDPEMLGLWNLQELRWKAGAGPRMQVRLELLPGGRARFESCEIRVGFAETTDGECIALTSRDHEQKLEGTYVLADDRLTFRWRDGAASGFVPSENGSEVWQYRLSGDQLELLFPDRAMALHRETEGLQELKSAK